ncbi:hypothetical protein RFI_39757, partial [Reticulomyxa filosa]
LFFTEFEEHSVNPLHEGIDVVFSSENFEVGYNIFDVQTSVLGSKSIFINFLKLIPADSWIIIHSKDNKYLAECMALLSNDLKFKNEQIICILRDRSTVDGMSKFKIMKELKIPMSNVLAIPEITKTDVFNAKLNALRKQIQKITKSEHFKVPASANPPPRHVNGYFKFENRMQLLNEHSSTNNLVVNTLNEDVKKL